MLAARKRAGAAAVYLCDFERKLVCGVLESNYSDPASSATNCDAAPQLPPLPPRYQSALIHFMSPRRAFTPHSSQPDKIPHACSSYQE